MVTSIKSSFLNSLESGDPFDPLSAPSAEGLSPSHGGAPEHEETKDEEEGSAAAEIPETIIDEATSGFLDKVNSGTINSAQFMPAIVDLPEKVKKKRQRKSKDTVAPPASAVVKKKRKRETNDSSDEGTSDEDAEYRPSAAKQRRRQKSTAKRAATRGTSKTPRRANARREALFGCRYCDFKTETIGTGSFS